MSGLCSGGTAELFALVAYVPDRLGGFVDRVRRELAPGCLLRAHITVLPPRELPPNANGNGLLHAAARQKIESVLHAARSFRVAIGEVTVFPVSNVVYLSIGSGSQQLKDLHYLLNQDACRSREMWGFEPHLTLAQDLNPEAVNCVKEIAERRWREYTGPHEFTLDKLTFVRGDPEQGWIDLASWELPSPVLV